MPFEPFNMSSHTGEPLKEKTPTQIIAYYFYFSLLLCVTHRSLQNSAIVDFHCLMVFYFVIYFPRIFTDLSNNETYKNPSYDIIRKAFYLAYLVSSYVRYVLRCCFKLLAHKGPEIATTPKSYLAVRHRMGETPWNLPWAMAPVAHCALL